ncbi:hypothetical protein EMGBS4_07760 [Acidimicrobiaceae bacterium]|nr:hypothetical protein EMGBS4_07760 [Acidimicrobiaceae bacterium]
MVNKVPPTDIVGANRSALVEGDTALPMSDIWRKQFDGALGDAMQAIQMRADAELSITADDLRKVSFSRTTQGFIGSHLSISQRDDLKEL